MTPNQQTIPACPRCGTTAPDIAWTGGDEASDNWHCTSCGHEYETSRG